MRWSPVLPHKMEGISDIGELMGTQGESRKCRRTSNGVQKAYGDSINYSPITMDHTAVALYLIAFGLILNALSNLGYNVWYWYYTTRGDTTAKLRQWVNAAECDPQKLGFTSPMGDETDPDQYIITPESHVPTPAEPDWSGWPTIDDNPYVPDSWSKILTNLALNAAILDALSIPHNIKRCATFSSGPS